MYTVSCNGNESTNYCNPCAARVNNLQQDHSKDHYSQVHRRSYYMYVVN